MILLLSACCRYLFWNSYYGYGWCFGFLNGGYYLCSGGESARYFSLTWWTVRRCSVSLRSRGPFRIEGVVIGLRPKLCTVNSVLDTMYCTLCTVHSGLYTLYCTHCTIHFAAQWPRYSEVCEPWQEKWRPEVRVECSAGSHLTYRMS